MEKTTEGKVMDDWYEWRNSLMNTIQNVGEHSLSVLVAFEQTALRSDKEKRCAECGDPGTVRQEATTYNHVPYWFCAECDAYWKAKAA